MYEFFCLPVVAAGSILQMFKTKHPSLSFDYLPENNLKGDWISWKHKAKNMDVYYDNAPIYS